MKAEKAQMILKNEFQGSLKAISIRLCLFPGIHFPGNHFLNFPVFVCLPESWSTENTFQSKKNLAWFSGKCFPENLGGKHFLEVVKNLEMSLFADYIKFDPQTFDCYI